MLSIIAGMLISMSCMIYLKVGGVIGALLFSVGLLTICHFKLELFTGKAGLLATSEIKPLKLCDVWCGNLLGSVFMTSLMMPTELGKTIIGPAAAIAQTRLENLFIINLLLGIYCGVLMYIAVSVYETKPWMTSMCVAIFILAGTNHCIADMTYFSLVFMPPIGLPLLWALLWTTLGNIIGTNLIPLCRLLPHHLRTLLLRKRPKSQSD